MDKWNVKMNIFIVGDSFALTNQTEQIELKDTYPILLEKNYPNATLKLLASIGNDTYSALKSLESQTDNFVPDFLIIQLGIVDCAPRTLLRNELELVMKMPLFIQKIIYKITKKYRFQITKIRKKQYVSLANFKRFYRTILQQFKNQNVSIILVNIVSVNNYLASISYGFKEQINLYNCAIDELKSEFECQIIDLNYLTSLDKNLVAKDGYHLSLEGNKKLFEEIKRLLEG